MSYGKRKPKINFEEWCLNNNRTDLLKRWDYELNDVLPSEISYKSNKKYYFICPKHIHESQLSNIQYVSCGKQKNIICKKCNSFAQYIINNYSEEYLNELVELNLNYDLWDINYKSNHYKLLIRCNKMGHECLQTPEHFVRNGCQYCAHRAKTNIPKEDSLGIICPKILPLWSSKNDKTPYDYYPSSTFKVYWRCENNIHDDFYRAINVSKMVNFRCPKCVNFWGEYNGNWKGGVTYSDKKERQSYKYQIWRKEVIKRNNNICQCCLRKINENNLMAHVHHIYNFSDYKNLRINVDNGITLCQECHCFDIEDSFHNLYGNFHNTPEQLEEYINYKRKKLGINIPFSIEEYLKNKIII